MAGLFIVGVFARNLLRESRRRNIFFHISFLMTDLGTLQTGPRRQIISLLITIEFQTLCLTK